MIANPAFKQGWPSEDAMALLTRIETADPNSPEINEDDTNACWGHYQLSGGNMRLSTILTSWETIGNTEIACKLIAATIKTAKVARHLCFKRKIEATSFLADSFLNNLIEIIWTNWKASGGVHFY